MSCRASAMIVPMTRRSKGARYDGSHCGRNILAVSPAVRLWWFAVAFTGEAFPDRPALEVDLFVRRHGAGASTGTAMSCTASPSGHRQWPTGNDK